jgi:hypothetical protein
LFACYSTIWTLAPKGLAEVARVLARKKKKKVLLGVCSSAAEAGRI